MSLASLIATVLVQIPASPGAEPTPDWPQWRGPGRDGIVAGPAWPAGLDDSRLELLWQVDDLGPSYAGPLVVGERVISVETHAKSEEWVRAFDRSSGEVLWEARWDGAMKVPFFAARNGSWIRSTPASDGERVYVAGIRDVLVALDLEDGEEAWSLDFVSEFDTSVPDFGGVPSPLLDGDSLYIQAGDSLVRLDKNTGEVHWRRVGSEGAMPGAFSSPILGELRGVNQLVAQSRTELYGVDPGSGDLLWSRPIRAFRGMNILTPSVTADGSLFTSAYGGRAQRLDLSQVEAEEGTGWRVESRWDVPAQGYMTTPVLVEGHAYFFTRSNRFTCVRLEDGDVRWTSPPTGDEYWSLVAQGDRILALNESGELILISADPEAFVELGRARVSEQETWAHLSVVGDTIFVRHLEALSAHRWK